MKKIIVCIPAFNEAKVIDRIIAGAKRHSPDVLVCDDGSDDDTKGVAEAAGAVVIRHNRNKGYGAAIKTLFDAARERDADVMVTLDSDGQHDPDHIPKIVKPILDDGYDIAIGSRFLNDKDRLQVPAFRGIGIKIITKLAHSVSYSNITDAQSGFRAYSKNALRSIKLFGEGMSISTEILIKAKQEHLSVIELPLTVNYNIENTSTHNPLTHGMSVVYSILQFIIIKHPMLFIGLPGFILIFISGIFINEALVLFSSSRYVSTPLILLSAASAIIGIILVLTSTILYALKIMLRENLKKD